MGMVASGSLSGAVLVLSLAKLAVQGKNLAQIADVKDTDPRG
jgi:hypothetical protein